MDPNTGKTTTRNIESEDSQPLSSYGMSRGFGQPSLFGMLSNGFPQDRYQNDQSEQKNENYEHFKEKGRNAVNRFKNLMNFGETDDS